MTKRHRPLQQDDQNPSNQFSFSKSTSPNQDKNSISLVGWNSASTSPTLYEEVICC